MWNSVRRRDLVATLSVALIIASLSALPQFDRLRGLSIDILTWARWSIAGNRHDPAKSPAVVIAVDEETYRRKPFSGTPSITWTRELAKILTAVAEGGATVVGFDIILPTSLEQSEIPLGTETLGERLRGFDRDFLRALAILARQGKVLLGQVQHLHRPIQPFEAQRVAVGQQANIRPLNLFADRDGVVRRVPLSFDVDGAAMPSMSVELAARAMGRKPQFEPDGSLSFGGAKVPQAVPNTLTINFEGGADDIPDHSLADLAACVDKGDKEYFRRHFGNRVVLFGVVLDVEDRSLTSKRLATGSEGARAPRCQLPFDPPDRVFARDSIAGVYVHATAVNNLMRGEGLRELSRPANWLINLAAAALAAGLTLLASPVPAVLGVVAIGAAWTGIATWAFGHAVVLPVIDTVVVAMFALATMIAYRFVIADSDKRLLRSSFSLYLAPAVIERMLASNTPPSLGGETRAVTVYFSDIAGFSAISERMSPRELVALMNEYLSAMTDIIEAHGGFVDKYIGDAIVAVFGAPADDPHHAANAVRAALACEAKLADMNRMGGAAAFGGQTIRQRIGLNSGNALVGNMGSRRRFNYTVMGDAVNLAARLESANKLYGTSIMAAEATVALAGGTFNWRELDTIRVSGREAPTRVFEPRGEPAAAAADDDLAMRAYRDGLACWRNRDFQGAVEAFARAGRGDPASLAFLDRARRLAANPPGPDWTPVNSLETK